MPVNPSTWATFTPITAHQLNQDMYTYDGSYFGANGVMFHSNRPLVAEYYNTASLIKAPAGGAFTVLGGPDGVAITIVDNAAIYGAGADAPGDSARFQSTGAAAPGSAGQPGQYGGWNLIANFIQLRNFSNTAATYASAWAVNGSILADLGAPQPGNNSNGNTGFAVDLVERQPGIFQLYAPAIWALDPSGITNTINTNTVTTVGGGARFVEIWCGVTSTNATVASIPVPITTIAGTTPLSAATLNATIQQTFDLLNYPPMLSCQFGLNNNGTGQVVSGGAFTVAPFTANAFVDNYNGFNPTTSLYTVRLPGIYFCHATIIYGNNYNAGRMLAGFSVNTSAFLGGAYNATASNLASAGCSVTKVLDLHAGDTVQVITFPTNGGTLSTTTGVSRWIMTWLAPINTSTQSWTPPDVTGFQFAAGTPPSTLPSIMNTKIANDINFLLNRPYLTVHQTTANTGLTSQVWHSPTMQSTVGLVHGGIGDNYAGWSTANNWYVAPVSGWYLAVEEVNVATIATSNSGNSVLAGFSVPTSGGVTAPTTPLAMPDTFQYITVAGGYTYPTGATGINLYYLQQGETIQPSVSYFTVTSTATFSTDVTHNFASHFNVIWMSN